MILILTHQQKKNTDNLFTLFYKNVQLREACKHEENLDLNFQCVFFEQSLPIFPDMSVNVDDSSLKGVWGGGGFLQ